LKLCKTSRKRSVDPNRGKLLTRRKQLSQAYTR
jgi:hypothetical protein